MRAHEKENVKMLCGRAAELVGMFIEIRGMEMRAFDECII
jgi:hypothetical protein